MSNKRMSYKLCSKCGQRIYLHRPATHNCSNLLNFKITISKKDFQKVGLKPF